jgi:galactokinase
MSMPEDRGPDFESLFGGAPDVIADAPGRVNLIGEHTDYHEGFVLPTVIPQRTRVELRRRLDRQVRVWSEDAAASTEEYVLGAEAKGRDWVDYIQGVTSVLSSNGVDLRGVDLRIRSDVPVGGGVSSSAALVVALLRALRDAYGIPLDDVMLARLAQRVETDFVGAPVGIMDQMAVSVGRDGEALFLDTRTLAVRHSPLPVAAALVVIDSGIPHRHAGGAYAERRRESFAAADLLGVEHLRDVTLESLPRIAALPPMLARRARHIVTENDRVRRAVDALLASDLPGLGALFAASHASMRDDYEVSTTEIDTLVTIGQNDPDIFGARLTGGGFGGAVVMLARAPQAAAAASRVLEAYRTATGRAGTILVPL